MNYKPYEGWGRHLEQLQAQLDFHKDSPVKLVLANPFNMPVKPGEKIIWVSTFEANKLPKEFIEPANMGIAVIVPAEWVRKVFISSGVTVPIYICPEGVSDNKVYYPNTSPFRFLHFDCTSAYNRKGTDLVIKSFIDVFGNMQDKVRLTLKGQDHRNIAQKNYNNIDYILEDYSQEQMDKLWSHTNCFVFPSRGEGFGLPPLEAMVHGIPTIVTNGSAMQDFATNAIPLPVEKKVPASYDHYHDYGEWDLPDINELRKLMEHVYYNYADEKKNAILQAAVLWRYYNSEVTASNFADTIELILAREVQV